MKALRLLALLLLVLAAPLAEGPAAAAPMPSAQAEMAVPELPDHPTLGRRARCRWVEAAPRPATPVLAAAPAAPARPSAVPEVRPLPTQALLSPYSTALPPPARA